ncbi:MAG: zinc ribbon domain-containing protein, partial [Candidatus Kapaibacteriota bacterium]
MEETICSHCGSIMFVMISNKGNKYFCCSRYPECKEKRPLSTKQTNSEQNKNQSIDVLIPNKLKAKPKYPNYLVRFWETTAVPKVVLDEIIYKSSDDTLIRALSQWRLDFPYNDSYKVPENELIILTVLKKILTRGRLTLPSIRVEEQFKKLFEPNFLSPLEDILKALAFEGIGKYNPKFGFENVSQKILYNEIF